MSKPTTPLPPPSSLVPYYEADGITVYNARCEDVLAAGLVPLAEVALIHADPPYGIAYKPVGKSETAGSRRRTALPHGSRIRHFPAVTGDDKPFAPCTLLDIGRPAVLWGANHYASRLPDSSSWLLWDKSPGFEPIDASDGEAAWSNLGGPLRIFRHHWRGALRASEQADLHLHPTQKPIALCAWVYARAKLKRGDLVFVPYLGSGPDLPAARAMGLRVIACDVEEWCCRTAVARLGAAPHPVPAADLGPLFAHPA